MPVASGGGHGCGVAACPPPGLNLVAKLAQRTAARPCCGCSPLALVSAACRSSLEVCVLISALTVIVVVVSLWLSLSSSCCFVYFPFLFPFFPAFAAPETAIIPSTKGKMGIVVTETSMFHSSKNCCLRFRSICTNCALVAY
jgi:hypothetical protein